MFTERPFFVTEMVRLARNESATVERFGEFGIVLVDSLESARQENLVRTGPADERGVRWEEIFGDHSGHGVWSGEKLYGKARLIWWNGTPETDERWERLDRVMSDLYRFR